MVFGDEFHTLHLSEDAVGRPWTFRKELSLHKADSVASNIPKMSSQNDLVDGAPIGPDILPLYVIFE
jgi:hypothetical protein